MTKSLPEILATRPVDRAAVEGHKRRLLEEVRAYRLRELREEIGLTQVEIARVLEVSQNRVSRLEHGDIERTQVDTLRRYVEAVGGELHIQVSVGERRIHLA